MNCCRMYSVSGPRAQRGFLLVTAVVLIVIAALVLSTMVFLGVADDESSVKHMQSGQALFIADSGLEYEQRQLAQNNDWYRSTTDPIVTPPQAFTQGTFAAQIVLPATELRTQVTTGATSARVYTTSRFPCPTCAETCSPCYLQIEDDLTGGAEFVQYTGISGDRFTGLSRGRSINGVPPAGSASPHARGDRVYPVTTLLDALSASVTCVAPAQLRLVYHPKFLYAGTISLNNGQSDPNDLGEEISYTSSRRSGNEMILAGLQRLNGADCPGWASGTPVTPVRLVGVSASYYESEIAVTGALNSTNRTVRKTVQR